VAAATPNLAFVVHWLVSPCLVEHGAAALLGPHEEAVAGPVGVGGVLFPEQFRAEAWLCAPCIPCQPSGACAPGHRRGLKSRLGYVTDPSRKSMLLPTALPVSMYSDQKKQALSLGSTRLASPISKNWDMAVLLSGVSACSSAARKSWWVRSRWTPQSPVSKVLNACWARERPHSLATSHTRPCSLSSAHSVQWLRGAA